MSKFEIFVYYQYIMLNPNVVLYKFCSYNCLIASTEMIIKYTAGMDLSSMYLLALRKKCYLIITPIAINIYIYIYIYIFNLLNYAENYVLFCINCFTSAHTQ